MRLKNVMMKWQMATLAVCIGVTAGFAGQGERKPMVPSFTALAAGDSVEMDYVSSGCFNTEHFQLRFTRGTSLAVDVTSLKRLPDGGTKRTPLGRLNLTKADAEGLDALVRFYRSKPKGGCTTIDNISVVHKRKGQPLAKEEYVDGSCSTWPPSTLSVRALVNRLETKPASSLRR